jgi:hypothetical protein
MQFANITNKGRAWFRSSLAVLVVYNLAVALSGCAATEEDIADQDDNVSVDQGSESTETATEALSYPGGSWVLTCPNRTVRYDSGGHPAQIIADCYNKKHKLVHNGVWVWDCNTGCFWNNDGHLTCGNC